MITITRDDFKKMTDAVGDFLLNFLKLDAKPFQEKLKKLQEEQQAAMARERLPLNEQLNKNSADINNSTSQALDFKNTTDNMTKSMLKTSPRELGIGKPLEPITTPTEETTLGTGGRH